MATWSSRGLRGSDLEELVNYSIETYRKNGLCIIQKIPTPITPIEIDKTKGHITLAYFDKKSTVDYIGAVQGIPVCFDAKECHEDRFPLQNIHEHQIKFMGEFEKQGGVSFFLIYYTHKNIFYYLSYEQALRFWDRGISGGRKSFKIDELLNDYFFDTDDFVQVPFLTMLDKDLESRKSWQFIEFINIIKC